MSSGLIREIRARQIFDSRGRPTVEVDVELSDGSSGRASVPSGASTGGFEACELRDGDPTQFQGLGVLNAVSNIRNEIHPALCGMDAYGQREIDKYLVQLDGTENLGRLGANAILGVSMAICRAAANSKKIALYEHIAELSETPQISMPLPMVNILSGGLHAGGAMDIQDFLFIPAKSTSIKDAIDQIALVRQAADELARSMGMTTLLADEGGLSPSFRFGSEALDFMMKTFDLAGLEPFEDALLAIDAAASSLVTPDGNYFLAREDRSYSSSQMVEMFQSWKREYPLVSIEDPLDENAWSDWRDLLTTMGNKMQIVGDDLFATNLSRVKKGIDQAVANAVLIKLNQNGTVTGSLDVIRMAKDNGLATIVSARSGETDDHFIADLAVGTNAGQIKIGSFRNSERLSKYNQLLRIEERSAAPHRISPLPWECV